MPPDPLARVVFFGACPQFRSRGWQVESSLTKYWVPTWCPGNWSTLTTPLVVLSSVEVLMSMNCSRYCEWMTQNDSTGNLYPKVQECCSCRTVYSVGTYHELLGNSYDSVCTLYERHRTPLTCWHLITDVYVRVHTWQELSSERRKRSSYVVPTHWGRHMYGVRTAMAWDMHRGRTVMTHERTRSCHGDPTSTRYVHGT